MPLKLNQVHNCDCVGGLAQIDAKSVQLAFADPPFNIGYEYDVYHDRRAADEYLAWSRQWIAGLHRVLRDDGAFWLAIGDEYAAELKLVAQDVGFTCRSWVIWYYTFGVNCVRGFSRSHTHLFFFVKDAQTFLFNADHPKVRVPSARQLVYGDGRANPRGRLPDNTWILRPQDIGRGGFAPNHDTWYFPRVAGTFKEREGFHGCQMPEQLLGRIIRCCSNPLDIVVDPFGGSGTTFAVAKKLGRRWIGFELSKEYVARVKQRLDHANLGDPLDGFADPLASAPATTSDKAKRLRSSGGKPGARSKKKAGADQELREGLLAAFKETHQGFALDRVLADPELSGALATCCRRLGVEGYPAFWNRTLMSMRKAGMLGGLASRPQPLRLEKMDDFSFASEIAMQQLNVEYGATLDDVLCDPDLGSCFDQWAANLAPGHTPFEYRWCALAIRKLAKTARDAAREKYEEWQTKRLPKPALLDGVKSLARCEQPGVYGFVGADNEPYYVGQSVNLRKRVELIDGIEWWRALSPLRAWFVPSEGNMPLSHRVALQFALVERFHPILNSHLLLSGA